MVGGSGSTEIGVKKVKSVDANGAMEWDLKKKKESLIQGDISSFITN